MTSLRATRGVGTLRLATPEGTPVDLVVATGGDRAIAFLIDMVLLGIANVALLMLVLVAGGRQLVGGPLTALWIVAFFLSRTFWFGWFETRWNGMTPGKRRLRLRVVAADGGPLTVEAILARNFTRELEIFLPLVFLLAPDTFWPGHPRWAQLVASLWVAVLLLFPLFNRARLRVGDLLGGTRVVVEPRAVLLNDLASGSRGDGGARTSPGGIVFTSEQLSFYGIYELHVLEDVLRRARDPGGKEAVDAVARQIQQRIRFDAAAKPSALVFLEAFYAAQRGHLEQRLLFGQRKERKG